MKKTSILIMMLSCVLVGCHQKGGAKVSHRAVLNQIHDQILAAVEDVRDAEAKNIIDEEQAGRAKKEIEKASKLYNRMVEIYRAESRIDRDSQDSITIAIAAILNIIRGEK